MASSAPRCAAIRHRVLGRRAQCFRPETLDVSHPGGASSTTQPALITAPDASPPSCPARLGSYLVQDGGSQGLRGTIPFAYI